MKTSNRFLSFALIFIIAFTTTLNAQTANRRIRVACVGNSITYGHGIDRRFQNAYPGILQQLLGDGYDVRNFGVSFSTLLAKGDFPYTNWKEYGDAKAFNPDIVTIKLGTNDSKPHNWKFKKDFKHDLKQLVEVFEALPSHPKVYLCLPAPCALKAKGSIDDEVIYKEVIPRIRQVAKRKHLPVIDLYTPLKPYPELLPDRVHPKAPGSEIIAREIYRALTGNEAPAYNSEQPFPGKLSQWNGGERYDFLCLGRTATVVVPQKAAEGRPWIWRPAFFDAFPSVDKALLQKGYHIVYYDLTHLYGSPRAVQLGNAFYKIMTEDFHLAKKVTVEGFSRGGYFALNWAATNGDKIACLYLDAPVCDITSWPSKREKRLWNDFLREWNIADAPAGAAFAGNALHHVEAIAKAQVPIIAVCGDSDTAVPFNENFKPFAEAYKALGGTVEIILKPGCNHHPHSLTDPTPVVDFIENCFAKTLQK